MTIRKVWESLLLLFGKPGVTLGLLLLLCSTCFSHSKTVRFPLVISQGLVAPDNFVQTGILINGRFPGPSIVVDRGDVLVVTVVNKLPTGFAMHFHGILQKGSVESDGAPHVTQDLIPPNATFTHRIEIGNQSGTFMYHAHSDLDLVWAFGPLIVRDHPETEISPYDGERTLILSQCWHQAIHDILGGLIGSPFEDVPDTASLLINGKSWGAWEQPQNDSIRNETKSEGYEVITVKQNETYRFRVIGLGMDSMLALSIENHTDAMVIEVDGTLVDPVSASYLQLNSAQRYSVLITMNQPIGNYWILSEMLPGPGPRNGRAILHYEGAPDPSPMRVEIFEGETNELELDGWVEEALRPKRNISIGNELVYPVPHQVDREIIISSTQRVIPSDNTTKFDINGRLHKHTGPSLLFQVLSGDSKEMLAHKENGVYEIFLGESVQLVFQNQVSNEGECEQHPWHTHGHGFHIIGHGSDKYDPAMDGAILNEKVRNGTAFPFRDVATLFPLQTVENTTQGAPCGWTAIRLLADNPGLWLAHCHLTPHQIMGKWFVLYSHEKGTDEY